MCLIFKLNAWTSFKKSSLCALWGGDVCRIQMKSDVFSGDRVIFAESPSAPGIPVVYRTPEERSSNPDRLNLDR